MTPNLFKSQIAGIPCQIRVLHYQEELPMLITGMGFGDCEPPEPEEFEFEVLDRRGYSAPWLEAKFEPGDETYFRILEEFLVLRAEALFDSQIP